MSITLDQAKALKYGDILIDAEGKRWRVTGKVKTWVTMPSRIRVSLKHGLYAYGSLTDADFYQDVCGTMTRECDAEAQVAQASRPPRRRS